MRPLRKTSDLPKNIPIFPLDGAIVFPQGQLPLNIFEPRYLSLIDDCLGQGRLLGLIQPQDHPETEGTAHIGPFGPELAKVGTLARITAFGETDDGRYLITLTGLCRFEVVAETTAIEANYRRINVDYTRFEDDLGEVALTHFDRPRFLSIVRDYFDAQGLDTDWDGLERAEPALVIHALSALCPFLPMEKQAILESETLDERLNALETLMCMDAGDAGYKPDHLIQ